MRRAVVVLLACLVLHGDASVWARQAAPTPVLVELFTSEGCSSCPPADQLLIDLVRTQPVKGAVVIGLGEHVDYWDHQGWKDPFSQTLFTERQTAVARRLGVADIYTPQMVVDGRRVFVGQDRETALKAIAAQATKPKRTVRLAWNPVDSRISPIDVHIDAGDTSARIWLAITEDGLASSVLRGENAGRTLKHAAVVRWLQQMGQVTAHAAFNMTTTADALPGWNRAALQVVAFAQTDDGSIVAAGAIPFK